MFGHNWWIPTAEETKKREREAAAYATALRMFDEFLLTCDAAVTAFNDALAPISREQRPLLPAQAHQVAVAISRDHLQTMRDGVSNLLRANEALGIYTDHELKPLMTRALNATREAVQDPTNVGKRREFLLAQMAVSRKGDIAKGVLGSMTAISAGIFVTGLILTATGVGVLIGGPMIGLGGASTCIFAIVLPLVLKAYENQTRIANDMSQTRKALPSVAAVNNLR